MEGNLGPKAISKRIKAKGLQKLKYYCELCQKQCRDENGFKCHGMSEGHQRQMQLFGENPDKFIQHFSQKFEDAFLGHLKFRHGSTRVAATAVYNDYISDRHHLHMNATRWLSLTEFVQHLGRTGKCKVENTAKGWFIGSNCGDNDGKSKRSRSKFRDELKHEQEIARQIQRASSSCVPIEDQDPKEKNRVDDIDNGCESPNKKVKFAFAFSRNNKPKCVGNGAVFDDVTNNVDGKKRKPDWLCEGIVVKVVSGKEKNEKGVVKKVFDDYTAEIQMLHTDTDTRLRIHQDHLQTVLPQIGGFVRIVNGSYRGFNARLLAVDTLNFCAQVQLDNKRLLPRLAYDDICKLAI